MTSDAPLADVMITLGARDLSRLKAFYRDAGFPLVVEEDDFAAFDVHGVVLAIFPIEKLASDGRTRPGPEGEGIHSSIGIMVDSPDEVDGLTDTLRIAGARVTKEPVDGEFFVGRSAYLCDPEENYFEIAWAEPTNPITARRARS